MPTTEHTAPSSFRLIQWAPFAIALVLIFSMMSDTEEWLYVAAVLGVLASVAVGRTSGPPALIPMRPRMVNFAKGWLFIVAGASLRLLHGRWHPMVFFVLVGLVSSGFFWFGCRSSR